jgi:prevent-host-death family protein
MWHMGRAISQRELRNDSGEIMRAVDRGETFVVTRNGVPVADLVPHRRPRFVDSAELVAAFAALPPLDAARFRADVDRIVDQDGTPRA